MGAIARLVLENGTVFRGHSIGADGERIGEVVFNTSMVGYQELLTDPSCYGQLVTMTYPLIGNTGVNDEDPESARPQVAGFIVKELAPVASNFRSQQDLGSYLKEHEVVAAEGFDTRALTRVVREQGAMMGLLTTSDDDLETLQDRLAAAPTYVGQDLVQAVSTPQPYLWTGRGPRPGAGSDASEQMSLFDTGALEEEPSDEVEARYRVVCLDCGVKYNSLRSLRARGCQVTVLPAATPYEQILEMAPDGVFVSNGPGDPEPLDYLQRTVEQLVSSQIPLFGICLGHQLLAMSLGAQTFKLKYGHRGGNQPVMDEETGHVEITCQNHGFAVAEDSLAGSGLQVTHRNLNDGTIEGLRHADLPVFSVQYHPEASPGPHDASYHLDRFLESMAARH